MFSRLVTLFSFCILLASCIKSTDNPGCTYTESTIVVPASEMTSLQVVVGLTTLLQFFIPAVFIMKLVLQAPERNPGSLLNCYRKICRLFNQWF